MEYIIYSIIKDVVLTVILLCILPKYLPRREENESEHEMLRREINEQDKRIWITNRKIADLEGEIIKCMAMSKNPNEDQEDIDEKIRRLNAEMASYRYTNAMQEHNAFYSFGDYSNLSNGYNRF